MLNLNRLHVLRTVVDAGSLTRAASRLHYSQSAVSQQIATLEAEVGVPLLVRRARGVALTRAGQVLYEHIGSILGDVGRAERELAAITGLEGGSLRLAAFPTAGAALVPQAIAAFVDRYPAVDLRFLEGEPEATLPALEAGEVDLAIVFDYDAAPLVVDPSLRLEPLFDERLYVALPRSHPSARRRSIAIEQLAEEPWINGDAYSCRAVLDAYCRSAGYVPKVSYMSHDYATVQGFVAAGHGIALIPEMATLSLFPGVVVVPLRGRDDYRRRVHAALPTGEYVLPAADAMLDALRALDPPLRRRPGRHRARLVE